MSAYEYKEIVDKTLPGLSCDEVLKRLKALKNPKNAEGMARFGIRPKTQVYGIAIPQLRKIAKEIKKNHKLAQDLWDLGIHEARILAGFIAEPEKVSENQFEKWAEGFDSWDVCDQVCSSLLDKTQYANKKIFEFGKRKEEFVKRTAFTLMACLAVHDKKMEDENFLKFLPLIKRESCDERNFVKKAVNWALRQIGKRNISLNKEALKIANEIIKIDSKAARWIAGDAIRELSSEKIKKKLKKPK